MAKQTLCILGGTGFVGRHLVRALHDEGHAIRVLTRRRERHRELLVLPRVTLHEVDVYDPQALAAAFTGCTAVVNLVGILNEKGRDGSGFERAHVTLPERVVEACGAAGVHRLLHMSALNADPEGPSHYLRTKGRGEALVHAAHGESLAVTSFRPSVIFGPGDGLFCRFAGLLALGPVFPLACARARFAPVWVEDVVHCFVRALDDKATHGERYELCGPEVWTLHQIVEYTARQAGMNRLIIPLGEDLSNLQGWVMEWIPGKPFSRDNVASTRVDSVCTGPFPARFEREPATIEQVVPSYLGPRQKNPRYNRFRTHARR
ncbi:MAG: complex I NDUFA9 subunit family protein [Gammaproteobacteria bacterium]|nr:complex I NDUFA9 subunit family protein [Gammaproteobacteria bacterium]